MKKIFYTSLAINVLVLFGLASKSIHIKNPLPRKPVRVYVDMVADLFHYGHVNFLKQAKSYGDVLIVGVFSDADVESYKRKPVLSMEERIKSLQGCKYVDEVLGNAPLRVTKKWLEKHTIDLVIHGDDFDQEKIEYYYGAAIETGKFKMIPYTKGISTSNLLARLKKRFGIITS